MRMPARPPDDGLPGTEAEREAARTFNRRYLHWDELRRRDLGELDPAAVWLIMRSARMTTCATAEIGGIKVSFNVTPRMAETLRMLDRESGRLLGEAALVESRMEESVCSSQIGGATTESRIAMSMLREGRGPRDESERMILNNYSATRLAREASAEPLTPELILDIHSAVTGGAPGEERFRTDDNVVVADALTGEVAHTPPPHGLVPGMVDDLCRFANSDGGTHPVVKAAVIHYMLALIHPFADGNGRTARALFYWSALRDGYGVVDGVSLSKAIQRHRGKYDRAYLLSETDGNDATYFAAFNLEMLAEELGRPAEKPENGRLSALGLSERQVAIALGMEEPASVYGVSRRHGVSLNTARSDVRLLVEKGVLEIEGRDGHRVMYRRRLESA